ncbi:serine hydrolase [Caulobacter mirabilis]|uniref:Serine hydrolase n=2 Tax=Caulobacter mirabilis TaxID=69666 RepID=A0A2D2B425_9CAUL|nr:serine hydrolase [Caulobacter mirabilis]
MSRLAVVGALLALSATSAEAAPPADLDARMGEVLAATNTPGAALAIVENGVVTASRGYGVAQLDGNRKVGEHTLFAIGSTGKAITAAAIATLVDQGKLGWDDKVVDHLPDFQMYDPWVTREMTIRDLLVHRSGLGRGAGDLLFVPRTDLSRAESVRRLRHLKPATSFRSGYAYDNVLYMVLGEVIRAKTGQTWEDYTQDKVLRAAGMRDAVTDEARRFARDDRAFPHGRMSGSVRGVGDLRRLDERSATLAPNVAPAGGVSASAADLGRWLQVQLGQGKTPDGGRVYSEAAAWQMWTPQVVVPIRRQPAPITATTPLFHNYALGWNVRDYRGQMVIYHFGTVPGFKSVVVLLPLKNVGFALALNSEEDSAVQGMMYELLDHYLDAPKANWPQAFMTLEAKQRAQAVEQMEKVAAAPAKVGPSLSLDRYAGRFADPWFGPITVRAENGQLMLDFKKEHPGVTGRLEHFQYDTFVTRWQDPTIEPAYVTFVLGPTGKVDRITMRAVSPMAGFSYDYQDLAFTPITPAKP